MDLTARTQVRTQDDEIIDGANSQLSQVFGFIRERILIGLDWPDLSYLVSAWQVRAQGSRLGTSMLLPLLMNIAVGGNAEVAIPLAAHWTLGNMAARVLDDVQDQDKTGMPWNEWPVSRALPVAVGLLNAAQRCLDSVHASEKTMFEIRENWTDAGVLASRAQQQLEQGLLAEYIERIAANTGLLFATACWGGARLGTDDPDLLRAASDYGLAIGMLIQIGNDAQGLEADLRHGRKTLPLYYALAQSEHPKHTELISYMSRDESERDAHLVANLCKVMGGITFAFNVAQSYQIRARTVLQSARLHDVKPLDYYALSLLPQRDA